WHGEHPGLEVVESDGTYEIRVPRTLDVGHERHFPLMLREFLSMVDNGTQPRELAAATLAKYTLLAQASAEDQRQRGQPARVWAAGGADRRTLARRSARGYASISLRRPS